MILAHNKSLLTYLHKAIEHRGIADGSVGYYVGGMKEADLKASESRKVIIATYAMASEGLDIKTLTTLVMASPKTDVCQSVGRILRVKHGRPLVIDIVDQQDIFRNQWHKRRAYYVKQNYDILMTDSPTYDAHHPVQWTPNHVAKTKEVETKSLKKDVEKAKGWAGMPIM
jgi:superfamily II DNA or RNA helicase